MATSAPEPYVGFVVLRLAASLSEPNQIKGKVVSVTLGTVMAEVVLKAGDVEIVSAITRNSAERMGLKVGSAVTAVIKATTALLSS